MKKISTLLIALALAVPASSLTVSVDGEKLPSEPAPIMRNGRVLVPMRAVFQALDARVDYKNSVVKATRGSKVITLRPNSTVATVDGEKVSLDSPAILRAGTTYVPLRFVAQSLGESVAWHSATKSVAIGEGEVAFGSQPSIPNFGTRALATGQLKAALKQLVVGNQGGVLKVLSLDRTETRYYRGLDDRSVARLSAQDRLMILQELGLDSDPAGIAQQVMNEFHKLPQKEALALLGVFNSADDGSIETSTGERIRQFLAHRMKSDASVYNRRQAVLALAVGSQVEPEIVSQVTHFYRTSDNLWETFPVQQFFEYQAPRLKLMPNFGTIRTQALSVDSLYRENIASYLAN